MMIEVDEFLLDEILEKCFGITDYKERDCLCEYLINYVDYDNFDIKAFMGNTYEFNVVLCPSTDDTKEFLKENELNEDNCSWFNLSNGYVWIEQY